MARWHLAIPTGPPVRWRACTQAAALFHRSGWTQEELAKAEGCSQRIVAYRVLFGRFLTSSTSGAKPRNLTERRFRGYWERTDKALAVTMPVITRRAHRMDDQRLDVLLDEWGHYMHKGLASGLGYPSRACGIHYCQGLDFDDLVAMVDTRVAKAVDACIDSLPRPQRDAIATAVLQARWPLEPMLYAGTLTQARAELARMLTRRGVC